MTVGDLDTLTPLRHDIDVLVPLADVTLEGHLSVPGRPRGTVLFSHGSGSGRHRPHNRYVAEQLYNRRFSTLLIDLLTHSEERMESEARHLRFDIGLLSDRLSQIAAWIEQHDEIGDHPIGIFGASTGAAAALTVAAKRPKTVHAVVSRGGRPDLAEEFLHAVEAPTLLIVGSNDTQVLRRNEMALVDLNDESHLEVIPGATHRFEEPGALDEVALLAGDWFKRHLQ